jgi:ankyrin repeat protein
MPIDDRDEVGATALFNAVSDNCIEKAQQLLELGANPNIPENNGITPLMDAASGGAVPMIELLLRYGARWDLAIDADLARWCYYRLTLNPVDNIGSAESVVLRTAGWRFVEAIHSNWEIVVKYFPKKIVEVAIAELHEMAKISYEYPVMLWQYFDEESKGTWVANTLAKLPSLESIKEFYDLPHMRSMYVNMYNQEFCDARDREAEKAYRRALAERNKRLNRAAREQSRWRKQ